MEATKNEIWHNSSLGVEDDARTSNTPIAQRKHEIPHSTTKNRSNIIECCNNTHQGVPRTAKHALALWTSVTLVTLLVIIYLPGCGQFL